MNDYIGGMGFGSSPCSNCEEEPKEENSLYCSDACMREFNGEIEIKPSSYSEKQNTYYLHVLGEN